MNAKKEEQNNVDQRFAANAQACRNLGIPEGVYWVSYALDADMAAAEAKYAFDIVKDLLDDGKLNKSGGMQE